MAEIKKVTQNLSGHTVTFNPRVSGNTMGFQEFAVSRDTVNDWKYMESDSMSKDNYSAQFKNVFKEETSDGKLCVLIGKRNVEGQMHGKAFTVDMEANITKRYYYYEGVDYTDELSEMGVDLERFDESDKALIVLKFGEVA